ncbi:MAG: hypothetical protein ACJAZ2_001091, partial [Glaciecola sp.]
AVTVMSGIFTVGEDNKVPSKGKIIVKDSKTGVVVGLYRPNKRTGKFLFILVAGKTYEIRFEVEDKLFKSMDLVVPASTIYKKTYKNINLGVI